MNFNFVFMHEPLNIEMLSHYIMAVHAAAGIGRKYFQLMLLMCDFNILQL